MITCKNCSSINVDIRNLDFARAMPEGSSPIKYTGPHDSFYCFDCGSKWESNPQDWELYYEYRNLADKTRLVAHDMPPDGSYQVQDVGSLSDLNRQKELSAKLIKDYKHLLDLDAGVWYEIEQDIKI